MNEYRIEKVRCPVTVCLSDGRRINGDIFLNPVSRFRAEPQDPSEFLNDEDTYFALVPVGGKALLVCKSNVACMETPVATVPDAFVPSGGLSVEAAITGYGQRRGYVYPEATAGRGRLLDYLNSYRMRFIALYEAERLTLVNRYSIAHVRELD